ncbi:DeoR/GlpR family DNA-binding transcription regulator [Lacrimispora sp. NSJ-141]|uniref:DeoR/GlpR transcriptional regulator n=2 Tax=Lachnospiraceae TaxID=186803 RepID=A0A7G9G272_9FIRM|nr:DeoR/GlpR family DNA-binding transcription regulator [Qiania dongpingensis]MCD2491907.1 DeoR/GlpR family DNA-binding transcription regulator [Lientehia hominis]QNM04904.1 DeoR/GlpR transcriptional regulator [Qiania dongpingensis]
MLREKRRRQIYEMLMEDGEVQTSQLCRKFQVSDMTIRRDLEYLAGGKNVSRTHGGAVFLGQAKEDMEFKGATEQAKEMIARKAFELIGATQRIFIDSGTTTTLLAKNLPMGSRNIVVTNNLKIVDQVSDRPYISVLIIGGSLRIQTLSCYGAQTEEQIGRYRVDIAFLGATTVGEDGYFYDGYPPEAGVKQSIIKSAMETYVLVDSSKFNQYSLISYSHIKDVTGVITDSNISPETKERLQKMGANLIVADL